MKNLHFQRAMVAGAMVEFYRNTQMMILQVFVKNCRPEIHVFLMENSDKTLTVEEAMEYARSFEMGKLKESPQLTAIDFGVGNKDDSLVEEEKAGPSDLVGEVVATRQELQAIHEQRQEVSAVRGQDGRFQQRGGFVGGSGRGIGFDGSRGGVFMVVFIKLA